MEIHEKFIRCPFLRLLITILSSTLSFPISKLETQQLITLHISSRIEYMILTDNILVLLLH